MMTERIFNTPFENALRILLLLDVFQDPESLERIYASDFLCVYGKSYGLLDENLNGDNEFLHSEFLSRKELVRKALKRLTIDGMVRAELEDDGIWYQITDDGMEFAQQLSSEYAQEYRKAAEAIIRQVETCEDKELIRKIHQYASTDLKGNDL